MIKSQIHRPKKVVRFQSPLPKDAKSLALHLLLEDGSEGSEALEFEYVASVVQWIEEIGEDRLSARISSLKEDCKYGTRNWIEFSREWKICVARELKYMYESDLNPITFGKFEFCDPERYKNLERMPA